MRHTQVVLAALCFGVYIAPQGHAEPGNTLNPPCTVFIATAPKCSDPQYAALPNVPKSAERLRKALSETALPDSKVKLKHGATTADIREWLRSEAMGARLPILVFLGHGTRRPIKEGESAQVLLTSDASEACGGVTIDEISGVVEKNRDKFRGPLIVIADCCRTRTQDDSERSSPGNVEPANTLARGGHDSHAGVTPKSSAKGMVIVYATKPNKSASDDTDLSTSLARGLQLERRTDRLLADPWFHHPENADEFGKRRLTLRWWFQFGLSQVIAENGLRQVVDVDVPKWVTQNDIDILDALRTTVIAQPPSAPTIPRDGPGAPNLVSQWKPKDGQHLFKETFGGAKTITRSELTDRDPYCGGYIAPRGAESGIDIQGKAVFVLVDVSAELTATNVPDVAVLGFDVKNQSPPRADQWLNLHPIFDAERSPIVPKTYRALRVGETAWVKVPLVAKGIWNFFAVSDVPLGCRVTIQKLVVADARIQMPNLTTDPVDLLSVWQIDSRGRTDADALKVATERIGEKEIPRFQQGTGWAGGRLAEPVWVSASDQIEVTLENLSGSDSHVTFEFKPQLDGFKQDPQPDQLGDQSRLNLAPGVSTHSIAIEKGSLLGYVAVRKPDSNIRVHAMVLKPRIPIVAPPPKDADERGE